LQSFLRQITSQNRVLLLPINTTDQQITHCKSIAYVSLSKEYLALDQVDRFTYYQLESSRNKIQVKGTITKPTNKTFKPCEYSMVNQYIQLFLARHSIPVFYQRSCDLTDNWIKEQTSFNLKKAQHALQNKLLSFKVDRLFFPNKSYLIVAYIFITLNNERIGVVNFICSITLLY